MSIFSKEWGLVADFQTHVSFSDETTVALLYEREQDLPLEILSIKNDQIWNSVRVKFETIYASWMSRIEGVPDDSKVMGIYENVVLCFRKD
jgi:hypothetical protein